MRSWLTPAVTLNRWWRAWTDKDPPLMRHSTRRGTVFAWLTRYNTRRRHSANGHLSPNEYERRHHTAELTLAA